MGQSMSPRQIGGLVQSPRLGAVAQCVPAAVELAMSTQATRSDHRLRHLVGHERSLSVRAIGVVVYVYAIELTHPEHVQGVREVVLGLPREADEYCSHGGDARAGLAESSQ